MKENTHATKRILSLLRLPNEEPIFIISIGKKEEIKFDNPTQEEKSKYQELVKNKSLFWQEVISGGSGATLMRFHEKKVTHSPYATVKS